jgi:hypothetical protein
MVEMSKEIIRMIENKIEAENEPIILIDDSDDYKREEMKEFSEKSY